MSTEKICPQPESLLRETEGSAGWGVAAGRVLTMLATRVGWPGSRLRPRSFGSSQQSWGQGLSNSTGVVGEVCCWEYLLIPVR